VTRAKTEEARVRRALLMFGVLIVAALAGLVSSIATATPACACACIPITPAEALAEADVVFTGTAVQRIGPADPLSPEDATYIFDVEQIVKGPPTVDPSYRVGTANSGDACGISFAIGQRYEVFANGAVGELRATACGGTRRLEQNPPPPSLGAQRPAAITAADKTQTRPGDGAMPAAVVGTGLVGGIAFLRAFVTFRRRRHRRA
jgi:hypothetical protein